jgi:hypothetical protein
VSICDEITQSALVVYLLIPLYDVEIHCKTIIIVNMIALNPILLRNPCIEDSISAIKKEKHKYNVNSSLIKIFTKNIRVLDSKQSTIKKHNSFGSLLEIKLSYDI